MILGIIGTLRQFFTSRRPSRAVESSERAFSRLEDSIRRLRRQERRALVLEQSTVKLLARAAAQVERAKAVGESLAEDVKEAEQRVRQAERSMELLRTEHEADSVAVETLTGRIKEYQALSEANIALSNHRRGQMAPGNLDREQ